MASGVDAMVVSEAQSAMVVQTAQNSSVHRADDVWLRGAATKAGNVERQVGTCVRWQRAFNRWLLVMAAGRARVTMQTCTSLHGTCRRSNGMRGGKEVVIRLGVIETAG